MKWLKNNFHLIILLIIMCIGLIVRFYQFGSSSVGSLVDEPAFSYSAYSILKTGHYTPPGGNIKEKKRLEKGTGKEFEIDPKTNKPVYK